MGGSGHCGHPDAGPAAVRVGITNGDCGGTAFRAATFALRAKQKLLLQLRQLLALLLEGAEADQPTTILLLPICVSTYLSLCVLFRQY